MKNINETNEYIPETKMKNAWTSKQIINNINQNKRIN